MLTTSHCWTSMVKRWLETLFSLFLSGSFRAEVEPTSHWCVIVGMFHVSHSNNTYTWGWGGSITLHACMRGKVIGLSVCCYCCCCPQKSGIRDLQCTPPSESWMAQICQNQQKKLTYLCSYLLTIHGCDKSWFLYTMPMCMPKFCIGTCKGRRVVNYNVQSTVVYMYMVRLEHVISFAQCARGMCSRGL